MYRHCIYCSADLGSNEMVERFPVGRRVAFDAAKGRLWAVCAKCARWNLAPIEERWEAVEDAERRFAGSRLRVHGENIGLAMLGDGTRLIRIGRALPRELAAWRYGDELRRRERARQRGATAGLVTNLGILAATALVGAAAAPVFLLSYWAPPVLRALGERRVVHRLAEQDRCGGSPVIRRRDLAGAWLKHDGEGLVLALPAASPDRRHVLQLRGDDARRVVERTMILVNRSAADPRELEVAVDALAASAEPDAFLRSVLGFGRVLTQGNTDGIIAIKSGLAAEPVLRGAEALAVEMALHEEAERRALHGELTLLEAAWRHAEEIAGIADRLALPAGSVRPAGVTR